jgi:hypothetical protein
VFYKHKAASLVLGMAEVAGVGISEERNKTRVGGVV